MRIFICKNDFSIQNVDENGFVIENKYTIIKKNSIWDSEENSAKFFGEIRIEDYDYKWIECSQDYLQEHFKEITSAKEKIEYFIKEYGYMYSIEDVIKGYNDKKNENHISNSMRECINYMESDIKEII